MGGKVSPAQAIGDFIEYGFLPVIDRNHQEVHEGTFFTVSHIFTSVANEASAILRITVGANKTLHAGFATSVGGNCYAYIYEAPTINVAGTEITPRNNNREDGSDNSDATVRYGATLSANGTELDQEYVPGGVGFVRVGGGAKTSEEWILGKSTEYAIVVTNNSGLTTNISISAEWYEES